LTTWRPIECKTVHDNGGKRSINEAKKVIRNKKGHERCLKIEIIFNLVERNRNNISDINRRGKSWNGSIRGEGARGGVAKLDLLEGSEKVIEGEA